jgi:glycosyltransferase involved in cell wall biosynthesis
MRVTFLSPALNLSGGNRVVAIYSEYLRSRGHEVLVVSPPHARRGRTWRVLEKLGFKRPAMSVQPACHQDAVSAPRRLLDRPRAIEADDLPDADVVIATWWQTAEWAQYLPASKGVKFYFVQHHETFQFMPLERVQATYRLPMQKIVVASWLDRVMREQYGDLHSIIVPNAIDPAQFFAEPRGKQERPTLGTLFHETRFKGFDTSLKVIREMRARIPDLRVVAFGEQPPGRFAGEMGDIELVVRPKQDVIRSIYASCDVWLSCSRSEGFNLTAMEAMACRTPVVSTRTGWPEEAIREGVNGALAEVDDVVALSDAASRILELPDADWRKLSAGAAATVADSSWEDSARRFEQALTAALASSMPTGDPVHSATAVAC